MNDIIIEDPHNFERGVHGRAYRPVDPTRDLSREFAGSTCGSSMMINHDFLVLTIEKTKKKKKNHHFL